MTHPTATRQQGFTLIELMITVIVAAVVLAFGVPSFESFIRNGRVTSQTNQLIADIQFARSEAIKRGLPVVLCPSADPTATPPSCIVSPTTASYDTGWVVFVDLDRDGAIDSGEPVLRVTEGPGAGAVALRVNGAGEAGIAFGASGLRIEPGGGTPGGAAEFLFCAKRRASDAEGESSSAVNRRQVRVALTGALTSARDVGDCTFT